MHDGDEGDDDVDEDDVHDDNDDEDDGVCSDVAVFSQGKAKQRRTSVIMRGTHLIAICWMPVLLIESKLVTLPSHR